MSGEQRFVETVREGEEVWVSPVLTVSRFTELRPTALIDEIPTAIDGGQVFERLVRPLSESS